MTMRDATIDGRQVYCPNASTIGYGKCMARVGYYLVTYGGTLARMIGRVAYAPAIRSNVPECSAPEVRNHILALTLSKSGQSLPIRWINPADVYLILEKPPTNLAQFFFAEKLPYGRDMLIRLSEYGTLSEPYVKDHVKAVERFKELDGMQNSRYYGLCRG